MKLNIKCHNEDIYKMYKNHGLFHDGDSGLDLFVPQETVVKARETKAIDLDISSEAYTCVSETDKNPASFWVLPRSSIVKTPLRMANSIGLIDAGYRGVLKIVLDNISDDDYVIKKGDRLVQAVHPSLLLIQLNLVDKLTDTQRGVDGWGSTGN